MLRCLFAFDGGDGEGFGLDAFECGAAFFFGGEAFACFFLVRFAVGFGGGEGFVVVGIGHDGVEGGVAIDGGEYPVRLGFEVVYLVLTSYDEGEGGGLDAAYGEGRTPGRWLRT